MSHSSCPGSRRMLLLLNIYLLLQPVLDVLTGLTAQSGALISAGSVVRALFVAAAVLYLFLCGSFQHSRPVRLFLVIFILYSAAFLGLHCLTGGVNTLLTNLSGLLKTSYFTIAALLVYAVWKKYSLRISQQTIAASCSIYSLVILLAWLTGTSNVSYNAGYGYCGWFYAANDISTVITLCAPLLISVLLSRYASGAVLRLYDILAGILAMISLIFSAVFIGTKLVYLGVLLFLAVSGIWLGIYAIVRKHKKSAHCAALAILLCVIMGGLYGISPLHQYNEDIYMPMNGDDSAAYEESLQIEGVYNKDRAASVAAMEEAAKNTVIGDLLDRSPVANKIDKILSRRLTSVAPIVQEYLEQSAAVKLLGLGYTNEAQYSRSILRLIELEPAAFLLRNGIAGLLLFFVPFLIIFIRACAAFLCRFRKCMGDYLVCCYFFAALLSFADCLLIGHALTTPTDSIFIVLIDQLLLLRLNEIRSGTAEPFRLS